MRRVESKNITLGSVWWLLPGFTHRPLSWKTHPYVILDRIQYTDGNWGFVVCPRRSLDSDPQEYIKKARKKAKYCVLTESGIIEGLEKGGIFDVSDYEHAEWRSDPDDELNDFAGAKRIGDLPSDITQRLLSAYVQYCRDYRQKHGIGGHVYEAQLKRLWSHEGDK